MPAAPDLETLFDVEPAVEAAFQTLITERGLQTFTQREVLDLPVPRADVQLKLGGATGHRHKDRSGNNWLDAWFYTLVIRLTTNVAPKNEAERDGMKIWRPRVRMIAQYASNLLGPELLPYHTLTQIQESGSSPEITSDDDCHVVEISFTGQLGIRADAWPLGYTPVLTVTPSTGLVSSGAVGGPFLPASVEYTLHNDGDGPLTWKAEADQAWLTVSVNGGVLAAGDSTTVTVAIGAAAAELEADAHLGTVTFRDMTTGAVLTRGVGLIVGADSMTRKAGEFEIPEGEQTFEIEFPEAFDDVPVWADVQILAPDGEPVILSAPPVIAADKLTMTLDVATPAAGYIARWWAFL